MSNELPTLLVLAAGMGSRYGGLKQIDAMGPAGEWLLEYAIYDAVQAGFERLVFVIGRDFADAFKKEWAERFREVLPMEVVFQELSDVPSGCKVGNTRTKPLGTGHAIWSARDAITGPFAVINADDYYGRGAFQTMAKSLSAMSSGKLPHEFSMVAYPLERTLSDHGRVSRGICEVDENGNLVSVQEHTHILRQNGAIISLMEDGQQIHLGSDLVVSMNFWGFTTDIFAELEKALSNFLKTSAAQGTGELYIPSVVDGLIRENRASVRMSTADSSWFGVTYPEDKARVQVELGKLVDAGHYPNPLWKNIN